MPFQIITQLWKLFIRNIFHIIVAYPFRNHESKPLVQKVIDIIMV